MKNLLAILALVALLGCEQKPASKVGLDGEWDLHVGITTASLRLKDENGILSGRIKFTPEFGGLKTEITGLHAANKIEFNYRDTKEGISYSHQGQIEGNKLSGTYSIAGRVNGSDIVWVATRAK